MPLDPKAKALLTAIAVAGEPDIASIPIDVAREQVEKGYARMKVPVKPVASIIDISINESGREIPVRVYTPFGEGPFPVLVFYHGGGWAFYLHEAYDSICTHICDAAACLVVSVDYRLAPEHKFPAAVDDCLLATRSIAKNCHEWGGDPAAFYLAGDSAGGNLAAVTAQRVRDEGGPEIKGQILIYPVTDHRDSEMASYDEFADGMGLTGEAMKWFWDQYLEDQREAKDTKAAPLLSENLSKLPPALVIIAGYDPVRDEGIAYASRMKEAGVDVRLLVYEDMIHGFLSYLGILSQGKTAIGEIAKWIKG